MIKREDWELEADGPDDFWKDFEQTVKERQKLAKMIADWSASDLYPTS